jgi:hypothetical protein
VGDDRPPPATQVRQDELGEAGGAEDVDLHPAARLVLVYVLDGTVGAVADVGDQHVDPAGFGGAVDDAAEGDQLGGDRFAETLRRAGDQRGLHDRHVSCSRARSSRARRWRGA